MDFLWIIILAAGAIASIMQKNQERQRRTAPMEDDEPAHDPRQEWERRIRRMMGEPDSGPVPAEHQRPATPASVQLPGRTAGHTDADRQHSAHQKATRHKHPEPAVTAPSNRPTQRRHTAATAPTGDSRAAGQADPDRTGKITDEFDLERAIIYSEILKPKFEDYERY